MTLEEKIKTKMDEYYVNKNIYGQTPVFEDGARWMLSELKPVMEEMKEALEASKPFLPFTTLMSDQQPYIKIIAALSKYNELFKT